MCLVRGAGLGIGKAQGVMPKSIFRIILERRLEQRDGIVRPTLAKPDLTSRKERHCRFWILIQDLVVELRRFVHTIGCNKKLHVVYADQEIARVVVVKGGVFIKSLAHLAGLNVELTKHPVAIGAAAEV